VCSSQGGHADLVSYLLAELTPSELRTARRRLACSPPACRSRLSHRSSSDPADGPLVILVAACRSQNQLLPLPVAGRVAGISAPVGGPESLLPTWFVSLGTRQPGRRRSSLLTPLYAAGRPMRTVPDPPPRTCNAVAARVLLTPGNCGSPTGSAAPTEPTIRLADELEASPLQDRARSYRPWRARNLLCHRR